MPRFMKPSVTAGCNLSLFGVSPNLTLSDLEKKKNLRSCNVSLEDTRLWIVFESGHKSYVLPVISW